jgi:hypothetical protein
MPDANTAVDTDAAIRSVEVTEAEIIARLGDGRTIAVPAHAWSPYSIPRRVIVRASPLETASSMERPPSGPNAWGR